jgi:putative transcriptional regulator
MSNRGFAFLRTLCASFAVLVACTTGAAGSGDAALLVAQRKVVDPIYASSVLLVRALPHGGHVGFIINKPTTKTLGQLFPEHEPSKKIVDPLFLGGPEDLNTVFALVERPEGAKDGTVRLAPGIYLAVRARDLARIIEKEADRARFLVGLVVWKPGELQAEMDRGFWFALEPDAKLVLNKKIDGLWEELVQKGEDRARTI